AVAACMPLYCHAVPCYHTATRLYASASLPVVFFSDPAHPEIYTLSLHDALPISMAPMGKPLLERAIADLCPNFVLTSGQTEMYRSEEHTSELQSRFDLVCRLLLEKKKKVVCRIVMAIDILNGLSTRAACSVLGLC